MSKKKISVLIVCIVVLLVVVLWQMFVPLSQSECTYQILEATDDIINLKGNSQTNESARVSDEPSDYRKVGLTFKVSNNTLFDVSFDSYTLTAGKVFFDRILFVYNNKKIIRVKRISSTTVTVWFVVYTAGMSDSDFDSFINSLSLSTDKTRKTVFGSLCFDTHTETLNFSGAVRQGNISLKMESSVSSFSFSEDSSQFKDSNKKIDGFVNTKENRIDGREEAWCLAQNEVSIDYNETAVAYDKKEDVWRVTFWTDGQVGGVETVYLGGDGITRVCVFGE